MMRKRLGALTTAFLLATSHLSAQPNPQSSSALQLTCRVQVTVRYAGNYGEIFILFVKVTFNPPQVIVDNDPPTRAVINDKEIIWSSGRINRLTGSFSDAGSSGPCEKTSMQQKF